MRRMVVPLAVLVVLALSTSIVFAAPPVKGKHGADGIGDPYFPTDGNGGYDVQNYDLDLRYEPDTDVLTGTATITAIATEGLSRFNLDYDGPAITSITVNGAAAKWGLKKGELIITPASVIPNGATFDTVVDYEGVPQLIDDFFGGGWITTDDGALALGQPHGATTWFPANDHPLDKATLTVTIDVPEGVEAISNGELVSETTSGGRTVRVWSGPEPMATYLAMLAIGQFEVDAYEADGIAFWDAVDPDLLEPVAVPTDGDQFAISGIADNVYTRLARTISVPAGGATVEFSIQRNTEFPWDFVFVEAHTVGQDDWTTLEDQNDHTSQDVGFVCPFWHTIHPFLTHYQTDDGQGSCTPSGTSGVWWAATGASEAPETWLVDLAAFAGSDVEIAITYASDDIVQRNGAFVDDIVVSTGEGTTSFEDDGDEMDGWAAAGPPAGSPGNDTEWTVGTVDDTPPPPGVLAQGSMARQPEILGVLSDAFGPYPFTASGGLVDDEALGFALETQTRPVYGTVFFTDPISSDDVFSHELAHMWYGDSLSVAQWQHIWLNEGFASYAQWLWSEHVGLGTVQENFDFWYNAIPEDDPFWQTIVGDPGVDLLFDFAIYQRGAMTLQQLRLAVGDEDFFDILQTWAADNANGNVTTDQFIALAEEISGQDLDDLFQTWLFTPGKPVLDDALAPAIAARAVARDLRHAPPVARHQFEWFSQGGRHKGG
jgi:hypothetical protein